jgi:cytochrome c oxidase assembly factor CtaG
MSLIAACFLLLWASPAAAHGVLGAWTSDSAWTADPFIFVPLYALAVLYHFGTCRLWRHAGFGRGTQFHQLSCFWAGWTILALALLSPLHFLSEHLLSAHMVEHELIMAIAAPLLVLSRPLGAVLWAFPAAWRRPLAFTIVQPLTPVLAIFTLPAVATVLHSLVIWSWHVPAMFNAALASPWLHALQHASFLLSAVIFWWAMLNIPRARLSISAAHLFATMIAMTALGALITLSPHVLYGVDQGRAEAYGLTGQGDQQLAGLIMWVPGCAIYAATAICLLGFWITARHSLAEPRMHGLSSAH